MSRSCSSSLLLCCSTNRPTRRCWHNKDHCTWSDQVSSHCQEIPPAPIFGRGRSAADPGSAATSSLFDHLPSFCTSLVNSSSSLLGRPASFLSTLHWLGHYLIDSIYSFCLLGEVAYSLSDNSGHGLGSAAGIFRQL